MNYRLLGRTEMKVSEVSFGAWAIGSSWGAVDDKTSLAALHKAVDLGVSFFDTADVYGNGRSEKLLGRLRRERSERIFIATKAGRKLSPHVAEKYTAKALRGFVEASLRNLRMDSLDLLQLHCPPTGVYYDPRVFEALDSLVKAGKVRNYGVSVEKVEEALKAMEFPNVKTIQIIFNVFRQRPAELFFREARARGVGIITRVPLASGMLTGRMNRATRFPSDDHRAYNRHGQAFDRGETFSGVDYARGLTAVEELRRILPRGMSMTQLALKWILMHHEVSCAIPGGKTPEQVEENCGAATAPRLSRGAMRQIRDIYDRLIRDDVHPCW